MFTRSESKPKPRILERAHASGRVRLGSSRNRLISIIGPSSDGLKSGQIDEGSPTPSIRRQKNLPVSKEATPLLFNTSQGGQGGQVRDSESSRKPVPKPRVEYEPFEFVSRPDLTTLKNRENEVDTTKNQEPPPAIKKETGKKYERLKHDMDGVAKIMAQNLDLLAGRGKGLDELQEKASRLEEKGLTMSKRQAWKNRKWTIVLVVCIIIFLTMVIILGFLYFGHGFGNL